MDFMDTLTQPLETSLVYMEYSGQYYHIHLLDTSWSSIAVQQITGLS